MTREQEPHSQSSADPWAAIHMEKKMTAIAFRAPSLREAVQRVQRELGANAIILRTREVRPDTPGAAKYFEVIATASLDVRPADLPLRALASSSEQSAPQAETHPPAAPLGVSPSGVDSGGSSSPLSATRQPHTTTADSAASDGANAHHLIEGGGEAKSEMASLRQDVEALRELLVALGGVATAPEELRNDLAVLAQTVRIAQHRSGPSEPLAQPLVQSGIEPAIARAIAARARGRSGGAAVSGDELAAELARTIRTTEPLWGRPERTLAALVGPSGSGKTTAAAKLAAEAQFVYRRRVGLISAGPKGNASGRVLQAYAEAFDVPWAEARSAREVEQALQAMRRCDLVVVDTPAANPWCDDSHDLLDTLLGGTGVERHVVLPATWDPSALRNMLRTFERSGLASLIASRLDEAQLLGPIVTATWNCPHPLSHVISGDEVPGGILAACGKSLARQVMKYDGAMREPIGLLSV